MLRRLIILLLCAAIPVGGGSPKQKVAFRVVSGPDHGGYKVQPMLPVQIQLTPLSPGSEKAEIAKPLDTFSQCSVWTQRISPEQTRVVAECRGVLYGVSGILFSADEPKDEQPATMPNGREIVQ